MDISLENATTELPLVMDSQQGPCVVDGKIDAVDVSKLAELQKKQSEKDKVRCYWFIVWPESIDMARFFNALRESGFAIAVSPLHDKDVKDPETGELSKPHYHVLVRFPSPRYLEPVRRLVGSWLFDAGATVGEPDGKDATWYVRPVPDYVTALRYLVHKDTPEKHRYPENEVITFGFIDITMLYAKSASEDVECYYQLIAWCRNNPGKSYSDLMDAVFDSEDAGLMRVLTRYSYTIKAYLSDKSGRRKQGA